MRLVGQSFLAVELHDHLAYLADRFLRQIQRVGAHVGDQADRTLADVDALVQLLRDAHGLLGAEAELAGGFLLQRRGRERRGRVAPALLAVDLEHGELAARAGLQRCARPRARPRCSVKLNCSTLVPAYSTSLPGNFCSECSSSASIVQYSRAHERGDLVLALADHAQRRALHAAGGQSGPHFLPQQRREVEADQVVERAPRLLRVDQIDRQFARLRHRLAHRVLGDLVEHDALHVLALELAPCALEQLEQMPGDRLALAIGVGREEQGLAFFSALEIASTCFWLRSTTWYFIAK
jgi:hypothetical protein